MDQRRLQYLLVIARAGSFSRAAAELHMTQPPLSAAIAQLEVDLGVQLLVRSSRGVSLTAAGEEVVSFAERMTAQEIELRRRVDAIQSGKLGKLVIGCNPILAGVMIPRLVRALLQDANQLDISLHEAHPRQVIQNVQNNVVDVGVIATAAVNDIRMLFNDSLRIDYLGKQEMVAILPPDYDYLPDPVRLSAISDLEFISPMNSMRHGIHFSLVDAFDRAELPHPSLRDVPSLQEAIPLITAGVAVGIMPEVIGNLVHPDRITLRRLVDGPDPFELSIVSRKDRAHEPAIVRCRETALREIRDADL